MTGAGSTPAVSELPGGRSSNDHAGPPGGEATATAAWLCVLPCAALVAGAIALLGPPLGGLLPTGYRAYTFLPGLAETVRPEPTEHARYLIALGAPLLGTLAIALAPQWRPRLPARVSTGLVQVTQLLLAALIVACVVAQHRLTYGPLYTIDGSSLRVAYFTMPTLLVAAAIAAGALVALRLPQLRRASVLTLRESRGRRIAATVVAAGLTALWMLHAVHSDQSIASAPEDVRYHLEFTLDETFAVLNGRTPLVDFTSQYGSLWPFAIALPMLAFGKTVLTFTLVMCTFTTLALLAIFGVFRRVTRSSVAALLLYLPLLATSLFFIDGTSVERSTVGSYFANFPLRYAGPFLLAWLTARRLERDRSPAGAWPLFLVAGLVLLDDADFGSAALGATVAALLWTLPALGRRPLLRLGGAVAVGLAAALALVCALTLVRAGTLPQLHRLVDYAGVYSIGGFSMMPIAGVLGLYLVIYLTYVAAIVVATVRAIRHASDRVLTGMLAWAGVFGLGSASYWVGRSHPVALKSLFSAWMLALMLLVVVVVRGHASPARRPTLAAVAVLFGFGVAACSLAQFPAPWTQVQRLGATFVASEVAPDPTPLLPLQDARTRTFVSSLARGPSHFVVKRGAPVAILLTTGHRVADAYGIVNVSPYTGIGSLPTVQRVDTVIAALRKAGGNTVILPNPLAPGILDVLTRRGFEFVTPTGLRRYRAGHRSGAVMLPWPGGKVMKMVDTHDLFPRALR